MYFILLTQGFSTIIDNEDIELVNKYKWRLLKERNGLLYAVSTVKKQTLLLHRLLLGLNKTKLQADHINGNGLDNRRHNLRIANYSENQINKIQKRKVNNFRGVYKNNKKNIYLCQLNKDGIRYQKYFRCEIEAAKYYNILALKFHGEFAILNTFN